MPAAEHPILPPSARREAIGAGICLLILSGVLYFWPPHRTEIKVFYRPDQTTKPEEKTSPNKEEPNVTTQADADPSAIVIGMLTAGVALIVYGVNGIRITKLSSSMVNVESGSNAAATLQAEGSQAPPAGPQQETIEVAAFLKTYMFRGSWNGLKILHACQLAQAAQVTFNLRDLCKQDERMSYDYAFGYLVASSAARLFNHDSDPSGTMITVPALNKIVRDHIASAIAERLPNPPEDTLLKQAELAKIASFIASLAASRKV